MIKQRSTLLNRTAIVSCLLAGAGMLAGTAFAQDDDADAVEEDSIARLGTVTVTAQKREQNIQDVPVSVAVVDKEQLENNQFRDPTQLTTLAPSVNFQGGFAPSSTNFNIRGVGSYAFEGGIQPSVSLIVDGIPYARPGEFLFDLADIDQVEVLRGPQGTLFGRNSTGGAISITRARPTDTFEGEVEVNATTDDEYSVRGVLSGPLTDNVRGRVAALYSDRKGYIENLGPSGGDLGGLETFAILGKLEIDVTENLNILLSADHSDRTNGLSVNIATNLADTVRGAGPGGTDIDALMGARAFALGQGDPVLGQQILDDPFTTAVNFISDRGENISNGLAADVTWDLSDNLRLKSLTSYRDFTDDLNNDIDGTPAGVNNLGLFPVVNFAANTTPGQGDSGFNNWRQVESDYFQQEVRLEGNQESFEWILGAFYHDFSENVTAGRPILAATGVPDLWFINADTLDNSNTVESFAIFGDINLHVTDKLDLFAGLRWTEEDVSKTLNNLLLQRPITTADFQDLIIPGTEIVDLSGQAYVPKSPGDSVGTVSDKFDFTSWRVGANYDLTDTVSVYASASRGQVGPAALISGEDTLSGGFLPPTEADNLEIGLKSELLDQRLRLNIAVYDLQITDLQASTITPGTISTRTVSGGDIDNQGIELDATFVANEWLTLGGSFAYSDATIDNLTLACYADQLSSGAPGCTIDNVSPNPLGGPPIPVLDGIPDTQDVAGRPATNNPEFAYNLYAAFDIPTEGLPVDFYGNVNWSWRDDIQPSLDHDDLLLQEAYGLLDITLGIKDKNDRFVAYIYGKNITDEFYWSNAQSLPGFLGRQSINFSRNSQAYYGAGLKVNF